MPSEKEEIIEELKINEAIPSEEDIKEQIKNDELEKLKELKEEKLNSLTVKVGNIEYLGDDISQNRMGNTGVLANWIFNKSIGSVLKQVALDPSTDDVTKAMLNGLGDIFNNIYKSVYKDNKLGWKGADNKIHMVQAESVLEALMKTMQEVGKTISEIEQEKQKKIEEIENEQILD
jgi:hypothetical protein